MKAYNYLLATGAAIGIGLGFGVVAEKTGADAPKYDKVTYPDGYNPHKNRDGLIVGGITFIMFETVLCAAVASYRSQERQFAAEDAEYAAYAAHHAAQDRQ